MLVICYGMAKSGSTLAFEMVRGILMSAGHSQARVTCSGLSPRMRRNYMRIADRDSIESLLEYAGDRRILAVKTHHVFSDDLFEWIEDLQGRRKLQIIASYRDPRDMCLSLVDAGTRARQKGKRAFAKIDDLPKAALQVERAIRNFRRWGAVQGTLRLYYPTVAFSPDVAIDAVESVLSLTANREEVMKHAFETAFTQKNKAKPNRYPDELSENEHREMLETFGSFIKSVCERNDETWFRELRQELLRRIQSSDPVGHGGSADVHGRQ
jgi:hypothetical protein